MRDVHGKVLLYAMTSPGFELKFDARKVPTIPLIVSVAIAFGDLKKVAARSVSFVPTGACLPACCRLLLTVHDSIAGGRWCLACSSIAYVMVREW